MAEHRKKYRNDQRNYNSPNEVNLLREYFSYNSANYYADADDEIGSPSIHILAGSKIGGLSSSTNAVLWVSFVDWLHDDIIMPQVMINYKAVFPLIFNF